VNSRKYLTVALSAVMLVSALGVALYAVPRTTAGGEGFKEARKAQQLLVQRCQAGDRAMCELLPAVDKAFDGDLDGSISMMESLRQRDDFFRTRCHDASHVVGKLSYHEYGILEAIANLPAGCMGGVYHGALEEWGFFAEADEMREIAGQVCEPLRAVGSVGHEICIHGLGHALERNSRDWKKAAEVCESALTGVDSTSCVYGAVASAIDDYMMRTGSVYTIEQIEELITECSALAQAASVCVEVAVFKALPGTNRARYEQAHSLCARIEGFNEECSHGLGMVVAAYNMVNPKLSATVCRRASEELYDACLGGASTWVAMNMDDAVLAKSICQTPGHVIGKRCRAILDDIDRLVEGHRTLDQR
jgi:hypothetical protein